MGLMSIYFCKKAQKNLKNLDKISKNLLKNYKKYSII